MKKIVEDFKKDENEPAVSFSCEKDKSTLGYITRSVVHKICDIKLVLLKLVCPQLEYGGLTLVLQFKKHVGPLGKHKEQQVET